MGITLWLMPSPEVVQRLETIMKVRPKNSKTPGLPSYPKFKPHITLASIPAELDVSLSTLRAAIPVSQKPLPIEFISVEIGSVYFRSVYIAANLSSKLTMLHQHVHAALGISPRTPAFPHISLCYIDGDDAQKGERERYFRALEDGGRIKKRHDMGDGISLKCGSGEDWMGGFEAAEIWVVKCDGPVEDWTVLEKIHLQK